MTKLDNFSKIYNGGKSIAKVYGGQIIGSDLRDISTNNHGIEVTASSTYSGYSVSNLFDGIKNNDNNRWLSSSNDTNPKLTITLDKSYTISQIVIHNGSNKGAGSFVEDVEIIIDGINQGTFIGNKTPIDINFVNEPIGKVIELKFPAGHNRIYEIEIYGKEHFNLIWQKEPDVYLAQDSDFVKINDLWIYKGSELEVEIPKYINGELVTSCSYMFSGYSIYNATPVTRVILRHDNVTKMDSMFRYSSASTLDLSSFNTSNVTMMTSMFAYSSATTLDLSSFNTSNVTNTTSMFVSSSATKGYARTQADANKFNASSYKPAGLTFVVK